MSKPSSEPPSLDVSIYTRWTSIFHSWFWRFYDRLFILIIYNLGWNLSCFLIGWPVFHLGLFKITSPVIILEVYLFYLLECAVSVGWAYLIFKIFIGADGQLLDVWNGARKYFLKAISVSAVTGFFSILAIYNLRFYYSFFESQKLLALFLVVFIFWFLAFWLASCLYQWPILFFQNPGIFKIFYRSFLLVLANVLFSFLVLFFFMISFGILTVLFFWVFIGPVFFFSFQCVALEKLLLKYKITYQEKPLGPFLELLELERKRGWREFFKPWENR